MSKTIKLEDQVYDRLEQLREKRETFSQVVERLLETYFKLIVLTQGLKQVNKELMVFGGEDQPDPAAVPDRSS